MVSSPAGGSSAPEALKRPQRSQRRALPASVLVCICRMGCRDERQHMPQQHAAIGAATCACRL